MKKGAEVKDISSIYICACVGLGGYFFFISVFILLGCFVSLFHFLFIVFDLHLLDLDLLLVIDTVLDESSGIASTSVYQFLHFGP